MDGVLRDGRSDGVWCRKSSVASCPHCKNKEGL